MEEKNKTRENKTREKNGKIFPLSRFLSFRLGISTMASRFDSSGSSEDEEEAPRLDGMTSSEDEVFQDAFGDVYDDLDAGELEVKRAKEKKKKGRASDGDGLALASRNQKNSPFPPPSISLFLFCS